MFVRCFCELNVCLDEYELFARPRVAGHYSATFVCLVFLGRTKVTLLVIIENDI